MSRFRRQSLWSLAVLMLMVALATSIGWCDYLATDNKYFPVFPFWHGIFLVTDRNSLCLWCFGFPPEQNRQQLEVMNRERRLLDGNPNALFYDREALAFQIFFGHEVYMSDPRGVEDINYRYGFGIPTVLAVPALVIGAHSALRRARRSA